jgi:hypothetical protein
LAIVVFVVVCLLRRRRQRRRQHKQNPFRDSAHEAQPFNMSNNLPAMTDVQQPYPVFNQRASSYPYSSYSVDTKASSISPLLSPHDTSYTGAYIAPLDFPSYQFTVTQPQELPAEPISGARESPVTPPPSAPARTQYDFLLKTPAPARHLVPDEPPSPTSAYHGASPAATPNLPHAKLHVSGISPSTAEAQYGGNPWK